MFNNLILMYVYKFITFLFGSAIIFCLIKVNKYKKIINNESSSDYLIIKATERTLSIYKFINILILIYIFIFIINISLEP
ncbi:hypothetical protein SAMN05444972_107103 [Marininema halotolerans]|uniref:Uncharacterized protein n=1 Tax=Marininema halotolerans TaxID=1155944 RepID=A0A1I6SHU4_9BACL|nr:hypothetical protein SAMN05444972_107103 [Marininema halotolerans]